MVGGVLGTAMEQVGFVLRTRIDLGMPFDTIDKGQGDGHTGVGGRSGVGGGMGKGVFTSKHVSFLGGGIQDLRIQRRFLVAAGGFVAMVEMRLYQTDHGGNVLNAVMYVFANQRGGRHVGRKSGGV